MFPVDVLRKAGQLGFGAMYCNEECGGNIYREHFLKRFF
jgi:alkylation response protein AidB-like acyl-CoA dehydrogenase